ncbi:uncharacterized protein MKK02DRAFT_32153 [Dioszegia hungarica]|uniref:Uncharacterized protein n=1 Tax=Dioszegia hungarica TaxID=4972 RepID=A0AA38HA74_9TREE|nr:uncharacterized protein MKK02DRAFT_32153 [Dioszegia hungarica]KAI9637268.1 hypothetical protein MKK02DRAFT_32153 [Dioszegia hungarica]
MPAMVTSSPRLHAHSPHISPAGSPLLRPSNPPSSLSKSQPQPHKPSPAQSGSSTPLGPFPNLLPSLGSGSGASSLPSSSRSYERARQPTQRPYQSALVSRAAAGGGRAIRAVEGDSKEFAGLVAGIVQDRGVELRMGGLGLGLDTDGGKGLKSSRSCAGSVAGSWEIERAELIVDVPVWSPGCFQDLSTLHALRDTTLSHTHSLLAHLMSVHGITASYRLLARSAVSHGRGDPRHSGWGCIRLAPLALASPAGRAVLKPKIRRSSMDIKDTRSLSGESDHGNGRDRARGFRSTVTKALGAPVLAKRTGTPSPAARAGMVEGLKTPEMRLDHAIADDDEVADGEVGAAVRLRKGYARSASPSDDEDEEDADTLVAREVEKRGAKEGTAFLMTLFGGPALILV